MQIRAFALPLIVLTVGFAEAFYVVNYFLPDPPHGFSTLLNSVVGAGMRLVCLQGPACRFVPRG